MLKKASIPILAKLRREFANQKRVQVKLSGETVVYTKHHKKLFLIKKIRDYYGFLPSQIGEKGK